MLESTSLLLELSGFPPAGIQAPFLDSSFWTTFPRLVMSWFMTRQSQKWPASGHFPVSRKHSGRHARGLGWAMPVALGDLASVDGRRLRNGYYLITPGCIPPMSLSHVTVYTISLLRITFGNVFVIMSKKNISDLIKPCHSHIFILFMTKIIPPHGFHPSHSQIGFSTCYFYRIKIRLKETIIRLNKSNTHFDLGRTDGNRSES